MIDTLRAIVGAFFFYGKGPSSKET